MEPRVLAGPPLVTREVDVIDRVDLKTVHLLSRQTDVVVELVTGTQHYTIPMFADVAPFKDVNVRLALKYAIDRKELVQKILYGHSVFRRRCVRGTGYDGAAQARPGAAVALASYIRPSLTRFA